MKRNQCQGKVCPTCNTDRASHERSGVHFEGQARCNICERSWDLQLIVCYKKGCNRVGDLAGFCLHHIDEAYEELVLNHLEAWEHNKELVEKLSASKFTTPMC